MTGYVFISYSRLDSRYVDELVAYLVSNGVPVWIDHKIDYGDQWEKIIREKIDACAALIVVMTPEAEESRWVRNELHRARTMEKTILPLLLSGLGFFSLHDTQHEDVVGGRLPGAVFLSRVKHLVHAATPHRDTPAEPTTDDTRAKRGARPPTIGIELGMTNSMLSVMQRGKPTIVANAERSPSTPSMVAFGPGGVVIVGEAAKNQAVTNPERTVRSVVRTLASNTTIEFDGRPYRPQEIAAQLLMKLKRDGERALGQSMDEVVLAVPAGFDDAARRAAAEAGEIAGLNVREVLSDTTAAGLAYRPDVGATHQTLLVFDLGGGTLSVSLLKIAKDAVEELASSNDSHLGGDDWDDRLVDHLTTAFQEQHGVDLTRSLVAMQRVYLAAEKAKIELSTQTSTPIFLPFLATGPSGSLHLTATVTRAEFQQLTQGLLERCQASIEKVVSDESGRPVGFDRLILAGGAARMPAVIELVRSLTGREPHLPIDPADVVAMGAAWRAGMLRGEVDPVRLPGRNV